MSDFDNIGWLARNDKRKSDKSPEYVGKLTVGGVAYELSGWVRQGKRGQLISLRVKREGAWREATPGKPAGGKALDDDIPF